ncbi:MAG: hypothetical protein XD63_1627 [Thermoanaerobacterales bacterium 50_218]|nr:MAG: hypothetical protein XD63_1627 [Thermoanaerobacterales bacterium 50_218]
MKIFAAKVLLRRWLFERQENIGVENVKKGSSEDEEKSKSEDLFHWV